MVVREIAPIAAIGALGFLGYYFLAGRDPFRDAKEGIDDAVEGAQTAIDEAVQNAQKAFDDFASDAQKGLDEAKTNADNAITDTIDTAVDPFGHSATLTDEGNIVITRPATIEELEKSFSDALGRPVDFPDDTMIDPATGIISSTTSPTFQLSESDKRSIRDARAQRGITNKGGAKYG